MMTVSVKSSHADKIAIVVEALRVNSVASTNRILMLDSSNIRAKALEDTELGKAAKAFLDARLTYTRLVQDQQQVTEKELIRVTNDLFLDIFKTPLSEKITLPILHEPGKTITCILVGLNYVHTDDNGGINGGVRVSSLDGRSHTTENFTVKNGIPYFLPEDLY